MKHTVTWKPGALQQLAGIWLAATHKDDVTSAVAKIDTYLGQQASATPQGLFAARLVVAPPLIAVYTVSDDDRLVTITSIFHRP